MKSPFKTLIVLLVFGTTSLIFGQSDDRSLRTKEFVVMGYQGLQLELTSGAGPYLRTLMDLLATPADAEKKTLDQLKVLLKANPNIMDFADEVILLGTKVEASAIVMSEVPVPNGPGVYTGEDLAPALGHLTRGMALTVTLKTGEIVKGAFSDYTSKRLWIRGAARRSIHLDDILAIEAPGL